MIDRSKDRVCERVGTMARCVCKCVTAQGEKELADKREARAKARAIRMLQLSQREEEVSWDGVDVGYH